MKRLFAAVLVFVSSAGLSLADSPWLSGVADQELVAVDGSKITLTPMEGRVVLSIVSPAGVETKSTFVFINAKLGTVAEPGDNGEVSAFFRQTDVGLEIQYDDGRTASLVANVDNGITLTRHTASGETGCMSWYPHGHVFSTEERRAAVSAYAQSLGLPAQADPHPRKGVTHPAPPCAPAMHASSAPSVVRSAPVHAIDSDVPAPPPVTPPPSPVVKAPDAATSAYRALKLPFTTADAGLIPPDAARLSIFVAEFLTSGTTAISISPPAGANSDAATNYFRERLVSLGVPRDHIVIGTRALGDNDARVQLGYLSSAETAGASTCLGVETQGAVIGFRNRCGYTVQFAFCVQKSDPALACDAGARSGTVLANGFSPLITATDLQPAEAERDFRWIACRGEVGTVAAHLDHAEPPSGRCVRIN
jgi:hypothetical protein